MSRILKEQNSERAKWDYVITGNYFFEGLNFTNDQHLRNLWNLRTWKTQLYGSCLV